MDKTRTAMINFFENGLIKNITIIADNDLDEQAVIVGLARMLNPELIEAPHEVLELVAGVG